MELKVYQTELPKESLDLGIALREVLKATGKALEDGFQPGADLPVIITSAVANLAGAINGLQSLPANFVESPAKSSVAILAPVGEGIDELIASLKK